MKLIKTTLFSGLTTLVKISTGFVSTKIVALLVGAAGVATLGAFSNFLTIILTFGNGAINTGVVKYSAEYLQSEAQTRKLYSSSLRISVLCSLLVGLVLIVFSAFFSQLIFADDSFYMVISALGVTLLFYSLNALLIAIINGRGQIPLLTLVNSLGSIAGLAITLILVYYFQIYGALYALIVSQTLIFFVSLVLVLRQPWFNAALFLGPLDRGIVKKLSGFTSMALVSALCVPVAQIVIRNLITDQIGIQQAGIWQGMMRISDGYLLVVNMALLTYYLPKLSAIKTKKELRQEIFQGYKIIVPAVIAMSLLIYLFRYYIIRLLYTAEFESMSQLFFWQLTGDVFKIASYILAYLMLAKAMTKLYILTEIAFAFTYIGLSYWFVQHCGLEGSAMAFCLNYLLYLIVFVIVFRKLLIYGK